MFVVGFEGTELSDYILEHIKKSKIGGVILFSRNYQDPVQLIKLINDLQTCSLEHTGIPLFISVDQEGGRVLRLGPPFTQFPSCAELGTSFQSNQTKSYAATLATELKACGISINYAPVLDILTNSQNSVIGDRAFGSDPEIVSFHGNIVIKEFLKQKLIPVGKHFPGHGATTQDSHIDLPEVDIDVEHLKNVETMPFQKAIQNGLEIIMTAHVKYHRLDPLFPATLSKNVITNFLKQELGFQGLVITDDLEMDAIQNYYSEEETSVLAVLAGADCLLVCHNNEKQHALINYLKTAVKNGVITEKRIQESYEKITVLKRKYLIPYQKIDHLEALKIFNKTNYFSKKP